MTQKIQISLILFISFVSCTRNIEKPVGSDNAKAVYNQAYQENYKADDIKTILTEAKNAYILIDPFMDNNFEKLAELKVNNNEVGAYISIGTGEAWRSDFSDMQQYLVSNQWSQWEGEFFVNETTSGIITIMKARIDKIADWGYDWVEFDNMDWVFDDLYRTKYGFNVTEEEGIQYYQDLCDYVHLKGMKCMAKNITEAAQEFDGVLYESYSDNKNWWNKSGAQKFLDAGKLVIINHYNENECDQVYTYYINKYNRDISYICEDRKLKKYIHYND